MTLVSICVPVYNGAKYLRESLDSILNQTYSDLEILVVNDCSTDDSVSIVKQYQAKDDRIVLIENEANLGLVGNWNRCISASNGEWIKLHFQDDLMAPDTVEKMLSVASELQVDFVLTDREYFFEDGINNDFFDRLPRLSHYFSENSVVNPSFIAGLLKEFGIEMNFMGEPILGLVKKSVMDRLGVYDPTLKQIVDFEYWIRLGLNLELGFIPERLHHFRIHGSSEGARNRLPQEVNPSHLDRIRLANLLHTSPHYAQFRDDAGEAFTESMLRNFMNTYTKYYGKETLAKYIDEDLFTYVDPEPFWKRLIKRFK